MASIKDEILRVFGLNWRRFKESTKYRREEFMNLSTMEVMVFSGFAIALLWSRFILKEVIRPGDEYWSHAASVTLAVFAAVAALPVLASTYWFASNAPEETLDERELAQRNRVYVKCYQYVLSALAISWIAIEIAPKFIGWTPDMDLVQHFIGALMFSGILLPPFLVAFFEHRSGSHTEDENES